MQPIRRWPSPSRWSTAVRAPARLSTSTLGASTDGSEPWRMIGKPSSTRAISSSSSVRGPGHDEPVHALRADEVAVPAALGRQRLDEHAVAALVRLGPDAPQGLGEQRVDRHLLGRLAQDEADRVRGAARQRLGGAVGVVAEVAGGVHDAPPGLLRDAGVRAAVEHERHGRPGHARTRRHVRAGRPLPLLGQGASPSQRTDSSTLRCATSRSLATGSPTLRAPHSPALTRVSNAHYLQPARSSSGFVAGGGTARSRAQAADR